MHNRLKIRTSAEIEAINKKKEQEKAEIYVSKIAILFEKRKNGEYDKELMLLTTGILYMNPDVSTVWNIRKEYLLKLENLESEDITAIIDEELKLTEASLRINPKSYCAWYHRCWVLNSFGSELDWNRELHICTKYLKMDDRNFHCWDYRKYIVERLKTSLEKELDYSLQKLYSNFSNYSAWHYRNKLLSRIHPVAKCEKIFKNDVYLQEISMIENAVYTDPNDQSAWFYYRWILTHISNEVQFVQAGYDKISGIVWVVIFPFNFSVKIKGLGSIQWDYLNGQKFSNIFIKNIGKNRKFLEEISLCNSDGKQIDSLTLSSEAIITRQVNFESILTQEEKDNLFQQLNSYKKLAQIEPNNKWVLLAIITLMQKLGEKIEDSIWKKLKTQDKFRENYYADLFNQYQMECALSNVSNWCESFVGKGLFLTAFYHNYFFTTFEEVDFSGNPFGNNIVSKLVALLSCKILKLSNCAITSIDDFPVLPNLRTLDISQNKILCEKFPSNLLKCQFLELLDLSETTISPNICEITKKIFPKIRIKI